MTIVDVECEKKVEIMMFYTSVYSGSEIPVRTIFASFIKIEDNTRDWILKAIVEVNELHNECPAKRRRSMKMHSCYVVKKEKGFADKKNQAEPDIQTRKMTQT